MNLYYVKFVNNAYSHYVNALSIGDAESKALKKTGKTKLIESIEVKQWNI